MKIISLGIFSLNQHLSNLNEVENKILKTKYIKKGEKSPFLYQ